MTFSFFSLCINVGNESDTNKGETKMANGIENLDALFVAMVNGDESVMENGEWGMVNKSADVWLRCPSRYRFCVELGS